MVTQRKLAPSSRSAFVRAARPDQVAALSSWLTRRRQESGGRSFIDLVDIYEPNRAYCLPLAETAREAMRQLEARGQVAPVPGGMYLRGKQRREVWEVLG